MRLLLAFLIGVLISVGSFCGYIYFKKPASPQVLAEKIEENPSPVPLVLAGTPETASPSPSSSPIPPSLSPLPSVSPSPSVRPSRSPSPRPTASPTPLSSPFICSTPSATYPTATPDVWSPPSMEPLFAQYASYYCVDKNTLERIANCESHFDGSKVSPNGLYVGLFQFASSTWTTNRGLMGLDTNIALRTNIEESIKTAAFLLSRSGTSPWPSCV